MNGTEPALIEDLAAIAASQTKAARFASALGASGTAAFVSNATSRVALIRNKERELPVTIDDGGYGRTYVASPHSAYVLYARDEIDIVGIRRLRRAAHGALDLLDRMLRAIRINQAVHLDNWLLSTNLHGTWDGKGLPQIREVLTRRFPEHFLILRSLDPWSCPQLLDAAKADGWTLLPSRQIWVTENLERDWRPRNDYGNDRRALAKSGLTVEDLETLGPADAARIADLYHQLYVGRYSPLNPIFTAQFMAETARSGLLRYRLARDENGTIMAVAGMLVRGQYLTVPVLGYDLSRPKKDALYRIATFMFSDYAMERGLRLHSSSGAGEFKRNRGARPVIEYMAVHAGHLSLGRRTGLQILARLLDTIMVPMMRKQGW
ncbi:GNAT family N-acetyltransferase [Erythrobacter sp. THAF29]|uniref:GNAT family N-acetyltransferase n=1 Tax=Erythrobacter sp. THAF29 TaxID=2587851 RepID=UPI0012680501|nr:GNAT family N-acetyltransferase [Erythrobacter sp. THAF29]QFT77429.1 hypothetical protein FIU90_07755 [Erythrobacter sp. THAF29]